MCQLSVHRGVPLNSCGLADQVAATMDTMDGPTNINVNLMIRSIDKIDDVKMEFSTQITFRWQTDTFALLNQCLGTSKHF